MVVPASTSAPRPRRLSDVEAEAWQGLLATHALVARRLDGDLRAAHGLSLSGYDVLVRLERAPERRMRMSELAESVALTPSGLTRLLDRLCRDGLARRTRCPSDARGSFAVMTDRGANRLADARETHLEVVRRAFLDHLADEEVRALAAAWRQVLDS